MTPLPVVAVLLLQVGPFETGEQVFITGIAIVLVLVGGVFFLMVARHARESVAVIRNRPISATAVADVTGVVEVQGAAQPIIEDGEEFHPDDPILYTERIERVTDTEVDNTTPSSTTTVSEDEQKIPFLVEDSSGTVAVDPQGATLNFRERRTSRGGRRQRYRGDIKPGDTVHVFGEKRTVDDPEDAPGSDPYFISNGSNVPNFTITDRGQVRTIIGRIKRMISLGFVGVMLLLFGVALLVSELSPFV